jgi:ribosomal protein S18 acetylase RimI-like enzyme
VEVRRVTRHEWEALRDVRLRALADAPDAFGTTYEEAMARPDEWWRDWAAKSAESDTQAMALAWDDDRPFGLAGVFATDDGAWQVISMWVDPSARDRGAGRALLDAVVAWARDQDNGRPIRLSVTDGNDDARRLYERYGFADTGVTEPLRSNSALTIRELELR